MDSMSKKTPASSLQHQIIRLFVGFTLFISVSYSLLMLAYSWLVEDNVFNRIVADEAAFIQNHYQQTQQVATPRAEFLTLHESWNHVPGEIYQQYLVNPSQVEFKTASGQTLHLTTIELQDQLLVLIADVSRFEVGKDYLPYISGSLLVIILIILLIALFLANVIARYSVRPLTNLAAQVKGLSYTDQSSFADSYPQNEIGLLASTIEQSFTHLQQVLQRESDFTRDVSHELRTPITILKNLLSQTKHTQKLSQQQWQQFSNAVTQLNQIIATLLAMAREESQQLESISLLPLLEDCIVNHFELAAAEDFQLDLDVADDINVTANANLLKLLINNLLSNALNYASSKRLSISATQHQMQFVNESDVASIVDSNDILRPQIKGKASSGLGLGLYLVKRICEQFGWAVKVSTEDSRFCLTILFE